MIIFCFIYTRHALYIEFIVHDNIASLRLYTPWSALDERRKMSFAFHPLKVFWPNILKNMFSGYTQSVLLTHCLRRNENRIGKNRWISSAREIWMKKKLNKKNGICINLNSIHKRKKKRKWKSSKILKNAIVDGTQFAAMRRN